MPLETDKCCGARLENETGTCCGSLKQELENVKETSIQTRSK